VAYTCTDSRSIKSSGSRDGSRKALKYIEIGRDGLVKVRSIDKQLGNYELVDLIRPQNVDNILAFYNIDKKGRMGLANMDLSGFEIHCNIMELASVESNFNNTSAQKVQPEIGSVAISGDRLFIYTPTKLRTSEWDLNKGLFSGRTIKPCWPVLIFDAFNVADSKNKSCLCVNDPYTQISDPKLKAQNIINAFPFNSGDLGVIEKAGESWYFNVFTSTLVRKLPQTLMADHVVENSIQVEELGAQKVLVFFKTLEQDMYRFRAVIYDCAKNKILWNASDVLWEESKGKLGEKEYKLVRSDNNRFLAVTFDLIGGNYAHQQKLEYRLLNINLNAATN
ncbi:MAG TPA: hypothetical protein VKA38_11210, partial [Draconibacterium sp.]|nr:hypothetical protein [Draconibacterium sp.]